MYAARPPRSRPPKGLSLFLVWLLLLQLIATVPAFAVSSVTVDPVAAGYPLGTDVAVTGTSTQFNQTTKATIKKESLSLSAPHVEFTVTDAVYGSDVIDTVYESDVTDAVYGDDVYGFLTLNYRIPPGTYDMQLDTDTNGDEVVDETVLLQLTVTGNPPAVALDHSEQPAGYVAPITIGVTGMNTNFDLTTTLELLDAQGQPPTGVAAGLEVIGPTQAVITIPQGLPAGTYTLRLHTGWEVVEAGYVITAAEITLTPSALSGPRYWEQPVEVTATGLPDLLVNQPSVRVISVADSTMVWGAMVDVLASDRLMVGLISGLEPGEYLLEVTAGGLTATQPFTLEPGIALSQSWLPVDDIPRTVWIDVEGFGTHFVPGSTTVKLLQGTAEVASVEVLEVSGAEQRLGMTLFGSYDFSTYTLEITTGAEVWTATLEGLIPASLSPWRIESGDPTAVLTIEGGSQLTFDPEAPPTPELFGGPNWTDMTDYLKPVEVPSTGEIEVTFVTDLPFGKYFLDFGEPPGLGFQVGFGITPKLTSELEPPQAITLYGKGLTFGSSSSVAIYTYNNELVTEGANVTVNGDTLTFTLTQALQPGGYRLLVTSDGDTWEDDLVVSPPPPNLVATLQDYNEVEVANAGVTVFPADAYENWELAQHGQTDEYGVLRLKLAPGDYVVGGWAFPTDQSDGPGSWHQTRIPFTIVSATDPALNPQTLQEPAPNVWVLVTQAGVAQQGAQVNFVPFVGTSPQWEDSVWANSDAQGMAVALLADGSWQLDRVEINGTQKHVGMPFRIENGQMLDESGQPIDLITVDVPVANLEGTVYFGTSGSPSPFGSVEFQPVNWTDDSEPIWSPVDENGQFRASIPASSQYYLRGAWDKDGNRYEFDPEEYLVSVDASGVATPSSLIVYLPEPNVNGTALDHEGQMIPEGWIRIERTDLPEGEWWDRHAHIRDGNWQTTLADGSYRVAAIMTADTWMEAQVPFTVTNGVPDPNPVAVQPVVPNVKGVAKDRFGQEIAYGWITFKPATALEHDWSQARGTQTDALGRFETQLPEGTTWRVVGVGNQLGWNQMDLVFTVPVAELVVQPPKPNLTGVLLDLNGNPLAHASIAIGPVGSTMYKATWEQVRWIQTDRNGEFYTTLNPGQYTIFQAWTQGRPLELQQDISIEANMEPLYVQLSPVRPNVTGVVLDETGEPLGHAHVAIRPAAATENEWEQMIWMPTNEFGEFAVRLEPGDYVVRHVSSPTMFDDYRLPFTVAAGDETTTLVIQPPVANVTGLIRDRNGLPLSQATLHIRPAGSHDWEDEQWVHSRAEGTFRLALEPGVYEVFGLGLPDRWIPLKIQFEVVASVPVELVIDEPRPNVTGTVRDALGELAEHGGIAFIPTAAKGDWSQSVWVGTNQSGQFEVQLAPGEWQVAGIHTGNGAFVEMKRYGIKVAITADMAQPIDLGEVSPPQANVTGQVFADRDKTEPLAHAWLAIKPADAARDDWSQVQWVSADANGQFATYLTPGSYKVIRVHHEAGSYETEIPLTAPSSAVQVTPPAAKVAGTLYIDGQATKASLGIRPVDASGNVSADATTTVWVEVRNGAWSVMLADGQYAVVGVDNGTNRYTTEVRFTVVNGSATVNVEITGP